MQLLKDNGIYGLEQPEPPLLRPVLVFGFLVSSATLIFNLPMLLASSIRDFTTGVRTASPPAGGARPAQLVAVELPR
jgi:hypothetical protein